MNPSNYSRMTLRSVTVNITVWRQSLSQTSNHRSSVRKAQLNSEQVLFIFFDIEKIYDLTWSHGILMDLNEAGIEGRMLKFIQKLLKPRSFKVKVNEITSHAKFQKEAIPHGSVLSPTLFLLNINKIVAQFPNDNRFHISLNMDDLQISCRHADRRINERRLQNSIDVVEKIAQKNDFKFSTSKTSMLHLTKLSSPPPIELCFGNIRIKKSGLEFDSKLDLQAHI